MKLYLSSYRIPTPHDLESLLTKPFSECRTAIIPNGKDHNLPGERAEKLDELYADLAGLGIRADIVDLRDYENPKQLQQILSGYGFIWVAGGNTYVLRWEMRRSGFDQAIKGWLDKGGVYGGESAGAIVAGLSLKGFEVADDPELADELLWEGISLTDKIIAPHMDSPDFTEYVNYIRKLYGDDERVVYLNDNEAFVINGKVQSIVKAA